MPVQITIELDSQEAEAFALFLKRMGFADYREHSAGEHEAYLMINAGWNIQKAIEQAEAK